jgi:hypothetical protein
MRRIIFGSLAGVGVLALALIAAGMTSPIGNTDTAVAQNDNHNGNGNGNMYECYTDADCDDGDPCTEDTCVEIGSPGVCQHTAIPNCGAPPPPGVGGVVEVQTGDDAPAAASGSGSSSPPYALIAGAGAAGAIMIAAAGALFARRRWVR